MTTFLVNSYHSTDKESCQAFCGKFFCIRYFGLSMRRRRSGSCSGDAAAGRPDAWFSRRRAAPRRSSSSAVKSGRGAASGFSGHSGKRRRRRRVPWGPAQDSIKNLWTASGGPEGETRTFSGGEAVSGGKAGPMPPSPGSLMGPWEQWKESKMLKVISPPGSYNLHQNSGRQTGCLFGSEPTESKGRIIMKHCVRDFFKSLVALRYAELSQGRR